MVYVKFASTLIFGFRLHGFKFDMNLLSFTEVLDIRIKQIRERLTVEVLETFQIDFGPESYLCYRMAFRLHYLLELSCKLTSLKLSRVPFNISQLTNALLSL